VLAFVLSVVVLGASPAFAHTATSAFFEGGQYNNTAVPDAWTTVRDPELEPYTAADGRIFVRWDVNTTPCTSGAGNVEGGSLNVEARWMDADGSDVGPWYMVMNANTWASTVNGGCPDGGQEILRQQTDATAGRTVMEWRLRDVTNNVTYARAKTSNIGEPPPKPTNLRLVSTSPGGKVLTYDQVAALGFRAGWTSEQSLTEMVAITQGESSFRTKAISYTGCCFGLMQVNASVHGTTQEAMFDPEQNVAKGRQIFLAAGSWQPWQAYTGPDGSGADGPWLQFEARAREAAVRQRACGGCAFDSIASAPSTELGSVSIAWDSTQTTGRYDVHRRVPSGTWGEIAQPTNRFMTDSAAADGTTYEYRVRGVRDGLNSEWSSTLTVTTGQANPDSGGVVPGTQPPGSDDDGSNSGSGEDCWSLNPLTVLKCALRWAFVPGEATTSAWEAFKTNLESKPPFSVIGDGMGFVVSFIEDTKNTFDAFAGVGNHGNYGCTTVNFGPDLGSEHICIGSGFLEIAEGHPVYLEWIRAITSVFVVCGTVFAVWRTLKAGFSSAPEDDAGTVGPGDERGRDDE
jgi:hypothetical protein